MKMKIIKKFYKFLKYNGLLEIYIKNLYSKNGKRYRKMFGHENDPFNFLLFTFKYNEKKLISESFAWVGSDEGYDFWKKINRKWRDYVEKYNIN